MKKRTARRDDCRTTLRKQLRPALFRALCDPNRLTLVARFASAPGPLTVTEASTCCGVHISGVSRHLAMLRDAGVVHATREGREVRYELDSAALVGALRQLADALEGCRAACCATDKETSNECAGSCAV